MKADETPVESTTYTVEPSQIECSIQRLSKYLICIRWASYKDGNGENKNKDFIYEAVVNKKDDNSVENIGEFVFTFTTGNIPWNDLSKDLDYLTINIDL